MKKQTLHQLNRIVYINSEFEPSTTYEFAPAIITDNSNVFVFYKPLSTALGNLGFQWFYAYDYSRFGTGPNANYSIYSSSVGGLLIDNTEIKFEPAYVEPVGTILGADAFSKLGITKVEFSNDGGTTWAEETLKTTDINIRIVSGVQYLAIRFSNATGLNAVNKVRFTFSAPVSRVYFALYNECKEG